MYPFYGEIITGYFHNGNEWQEKPSAVFLFADSYTDAMSKLEKHYGEELVELSYLAAFEETSIDLVEMTVKTGRAFIEDAYDYRVGKGGDAKTLEEEI